MQPTIFISYRRDDDPAFVDRVHDRLKDEFPEENIFLDIGAIKAGFDFREEIQREIAKVDVMLVMIGERWYEILDDRREIKNDFVRIEIQQALNLDKLVIPVFINGAVMPDEEDLPESIQGLGYRHGIEIRRKTFEHDVSTLIEQLKESSSEKRVRNELQKRANNQISLIEVYEGWQNVARDYRSSYQGDPILQNIGRLMSAFWFSEVQSNTIFVCTGNPEAYHHLKENPIAHSWVKREVSNAVGIQLDIEYEFHEIPF